MDKMGQWEDKTGHLERRPPAFEAGGLEKDQLRDGSGLAQVAAAGELASALSQSVRSCLVSITMRLHSLERLSLPNDQREDLDVICEKTDTIGRIVQDC
ncbi:MAG: hypothetical protein SWH78_11805 [Thermodesulfobacteriota bacterium]|nr:hypothetical protein [Thermodesulfobacteriota bacterium]